MATVAEYFAVLGLQPDRGSFAVGERLLGGIQVAATRLVGAVAAAFAVDSIIDFVANTIEALPAINDVAQQTGFTAEEIQKLGFAAGQSGADAESLNSALGKLTKNVGEAKKGGQGAVDAFAALGISIGDLKRLSQGEILSRVSDGLAKIAGPSGKGGLAERAEIATALFGLSGAKLVPFLSAGSEAIAQMGEEADALGLIIEGDTITAVDNLDDSLNASKATIIGAARSIVLQLLPAIEAGAAGFAAFARLISRIPRFVNNNARAIKILAGIIGVGLVGALVNATAAFLATSVASLIAAAAAGGALPAAFFAAVFAIDAASAAALRFALRMLAIAAPALAAGALLGIIILVVDDIVTAMRGGDSFFASFIGRFGQLRDSLLGVVSDGSFPLWVRAAAAAGAYFSAILGIVDGQVESFFNLLLRLGDLKDFVVALFTDPVNTLRGFFFDTIASFRTFVSDALGLAAQVTSTIAEVAPGFLGGGLGSLAGGLSAASAKAASITPGSAIPTVTSAISNAANSVTVGAPQVTISVTSSGGAEDTGRAVGDAVGPALSRALRAAAVDLLPGAG